MKELPIMNSATKALRIVIPLLASLSWTAVATAAADVWPLLKKPGHIILLRHSNAPGSIPESTA